MPADGRCPSYGPPQVPPYPGVQPDPSTRTYTKCYKTAEQASPCFFRAGSNEDCLTNLMRQLQSAATQVCCPGPCAWIFEHGYHRRTVPASGDTPPYEPPQPIYAFSLDNTPTGTSFPVYPSLRAGCLLAYDRLSYVPANLIAGTVRVTHTAPRTCPSVMTSLTGASGTSPLCVQRTHVPQVVPPNNDPYTTGRPQLAMSCNVHCCEGDLCNGATLRTNMYGSLPGVDFVLRGDGSGRVVNPAVIGFTTFISSFIMLAM
ncbi:hypothetical protein RvY_00570-2 [Ramazzottius varieornatus]|nr:hypothetical protein RvY_00570-2 [Ramazzottius varieornatus]